MRKPIFIHHKSFNIFMGYSDPDHCDAAAEVTAVAEGKPARKSSRKTESTAE